MSDEIRELQRQVSELMRNTAGLPVRIAGGSGAGGSSEGRSTARVIDPISDASDNLIANWGSGGVHLLDPDTGEEIVTTDPTPVVNPLQLAFGEDYWVEIEAFGGTYKVTDGSCSPWAWAAIP